MPEPNGWDEWGKHVLKELERHSDGLEQLQKEVAAIHSEIATLKVMAGIWGAIGATIPAAAVVLWQLVK